MAAEDTRTKMAALAILATISIATNYATRSLIPILAHAVCVEGVECSAAQLVSASTSAFFVGDLVAQFTAGILVRAVAGPWLLGLSTAGWALATLFIPMALNSPSPTQTHGLLQGIRGVWCGMGYPAAHAVVAATPIEVRATVLGLINAAAGIGAMLPLPPTAHRPPPTTHHAHHHLQARCSPTSACQRCSAGSRGRYRSCCSECWGSAALLEMSSRCGGRIPQRLTGLTGHTPHSSRGERWL